MGRGGGMYRPARCVPWHRPRRMDERANAGAPWRSACCCCSGGRAPGFGDSGVACCDQKSGTDPRTCRGRAAAGRAARGRRHPGNGGGPTAPRVARRPARRRPRHKRLYARRATNRARPVSPARNAGAARALACATLLHSSCPVAQSTPASTICSVSTCRASAHWGRVSNNGCLVTRRSQHQHIHTMLHIYGVGHHKKGREQAHRGGGGGR